MIHFISNIDINKPFYNLILNDFWLKSKGKKERKTKT